MKTLTALSTLGLRLGQPQLWACPKWGNDPLCPAFHSVIGQPGLWCLTDLDYKRRGAVLLSPEQAIALVASGVTSPLVSALSGWVRVTTGESGVLMRRSAFEALVAVPEAREILAAA